MHTHALPLPPLTSSHKSLPSLSTASTPGSSADSFKKEKQIQRPRWAAPVPGKTRTHHIWANFSNFPTHSHVHDNERKVGKAEETKLCPWWISDPGRARRKRSLSLPSAGRPKVSAVPGPRRTQSRARQSPSGWDPRLPPGALGATRTRAGRRRFAAQEAASAREGRGVTCLASGRRREAYSRPHCASPTLPSLHPTPGLGAELSEGGCGDQLQQVQSRVAPNPVQPESASEPVWTQTSNPLPAKYKGFLSCPPSRLPNNSKSPHLGLDELEAREDDGAHLGKRVDLGGAVLCSHSPPFLGSGMCREKAEGASGVRARVVPPSRKWHGFSPHLMITISRRQCRPLSNHLSVSKLGKDQEVERWKNKCLCIYLFIWKKNFNYHQNLVLTLDWTVLEWQDIVLNRNTCVISRSL